MVSFHCFSLINDKPGSVSASSIPTYILSVVTVGPLYSGHIRDKLWSRFMGVY